MKYEEIKDPYCTGDHWYSIYELVEGEWDSEEVLAYLMESDYDVIPDIIPEFPVDGDAGVLYFEVFPKDIMSEADIAIFENFVKENSNEN